MAALFAHALANAPSAIIIDDFHEIASSRDDTITSQLQGCLKSILFQQWDDAARAPEAVLVMAATNRPWAIDPAFLRLSQQRIYIGLPEPHVREELLCIHLHRFRTTFKPDTASLKDLVERTEGMTCEAIVMRMQDLQWALLKELNKSTRWVEVCRCPNANTSYIGSADRCVVGS